MDTTERDRKSPIWKLLKFVETRRNQDAFSES